MASSELPRAFRRMDLAIILSLRDQSLEHAPATLESLDRTLPATWGGKVVVLDGTSSGPLPVPPRPDWPTLRADRNTAVGRTGAATLCFLESGVILRPGWLRPMWRLLSGSRRAGCVGNIHREPYSGLIDHIGIGFNAAGRPICLGRDSAILPRAASDRRAAVSMACCLVRRDVFTRLAGFDPGFCGRLAGVDFCLRAAEAGYRHYVANRSVVYGYDTGGLVADDPDFPRYQERWGQRASRCFTRRAHLRREGPGTAFSPEHWEMAREWRRIQGLEVEESRRLGSRYLLKHWFRPWRYNAARFSRALEQVVAPPPASFPLISGFPEDTARADDGWLFEPPAHP